MSILKADQVQTTGGKTILKSTGSIIQVKQSVETQPRTAIAGNFHADGGNNFANFADIPGALSVDIAPSSSNNKILVSYHLYIGGNSTVTYLRLLRDSTGLAIPSGVTNGSTGVNFIQNNGNGFMTTNSFQFLDSPNTTNTVTYKLQWAGNSNSGYTLYLNRYPGSSDSYIGSSSITVMEVSA